MSPGPRRLRVSDDPAHADVDERRRLGLELEAGWKLLQFERHAEPALDGLIAGNDHPEEHGNAERQHLQPEMPERPDRLHAYSTRV